MDPKSMWNDRYGNDQYAYGRQPNRFFREQLATIPKGKMLLPAEGEGRNAVYAAKQGWEVDAFDISQEGKKKADLLAKEAGVAIRYEIAAVRDFSFPPSSYHLAGLFFAHLPPTERSYLHQKVWDSLLPGGYLIVEAFAKGQVGKTSGGPKRPDMLLDESDIHHDFPAAEHVILSIEDIELDEGPYHQGLATTLRFVGRKK